MDYNSNLVRFFILAPILPECLILAAIFWHHRQKYIPWFTIFLIFDALSGAALFYIYQCMNPWDYVIAAWLQSIAMFTIAFMVIIELFQNLVSEYPLAKKFGRYLLAVTGILLVGVALIAGTTGSAHTSPVIKIPLVLQRGLMWIQVGALVAMFAFSRYTAVGWRHYQFGIGLGYGLYASLRLAMLAYVAQMGAAVSYRTMIVEQIGYQCTVLLWTIYLLKPEVVTSRAELPNVGGLLKDWSDTLSDLSRNSNSTPR